MNANHERHAVEVQDVTKSFNGRKVVDRLSFVVAPEEIFGLIGPNGAGKTTMIRMMMDIIRPDAGQVSILGKKLGEGTKDVIGYLPEERGMYRKMRVIDSMAYLASLKGMDSKETGERADELLQRVGMAAHRAKKVEELSRGMAQLVEFLTTIMHRPRLLILDEPFANLDPVNVELMKEIIFDLKKQGQAIILSTHRMNDVEELCDRVLMISGGQRVLYGGLAEIKSRFRSDSVILEYGGELGKINGISGTHQHGRYLELILDGKTSPRDILNQLAGQPITVSRFEIATPSLQEIFLRVVKNGQ
ncbi:MAG: sodium ABC transporter [Chloroflexi bacterium RBG_16_57_8]|nr:MAG: sodium ABC transporter [Chloroflexi bacterium RBG_16_57_8]